jgi:hypothetical protein
VKTQVRSVRKSGVFNKNLMDFGKSLPKKALRKIKNYFRVQAEEPLQGLLCQNCPVKKYCLRSK